jgi:hypothetical protein
VIGSWVSIDGGNEAKTGRACYLAHWRADNSLLGVEAATIDQVRHRSVVSHVVVERHQQDKRIAGGGGRVPPGVIIDLAWNTAAVAYSLAGGAPVIEYTPNDWIGGVAKAVLHQRIRAALSTAERNVVAAFGTVRDQLSDRELGACLVMNLKRLATGKPPLKHRWFNVLDAVGVGLFHICRVGKGAAPIRRAS